MPCVRVVDFEGVWISDSNCKMEWQNQTNHALNFGLNASWIKQENMMSYQVNNFRRRQQHAANWECQTWGAITGDICKCTANGLIDEVIVPGACQYIPPPTSWVFSFSNRKSQNIIMYANYIPRGQIHSVEREGGGLNTSAKLYGLHFKTYKWGGHWMWLENVWLRKGSNCTCLRQMQWGSFDFVCWGNKKSKRERRVEKFKPFHFQVRDHVFRTFLNWHNTSTERFLWISGKLLSQQRQKSYKQRFWSGQVQIQLGGKKAKYKNAKYNVISFVRRYITFCFCVALAQTISSFFFFYVVVLPFSCSLINCGAWKVCVCVRGSSNLVRRIVSPSFGKEIVCHCEK